MSGNELATHGADALGIPRWRLEILASLGESPRSVTRLMEDTGLSRNGVWRHLYALEAAGIVIRQKTQTPARFRPIQVFVLNRDALEDALWYVVDVVGGPRDGVESRVLP